MRLVLGLVLALSSVAAAEPSVTKQSDPDHREYGEKWSRELGIAGGFMFAPRFHNLTVTPSYGYFIADGVQVTGMLSLTDLRGGDSRMTIVSAMLEPSYHVKLDDKLLGFIGFGFGYAYTQGGNGGLAAETRVGAQFKVLRNSLFVPTVSYDLRTNRDGDNMETVVEVAARRAIRINLGYTTIF